MDLKNILKENGKSYTLEREVIFNEIKSLHHFSYADLENKLTNISRASIFRNLNLFKSIWIIDIVDNKEWALIYEIYNEKNHHEHMKCLDCWDIIEFDDSEVHDLFEKISRKHHFSLQKHTISFEWTCEKCTK